MNNGLTTAVIVSYGDRSNYFTKVLLALNESDKIDKIIFVNNAISKESRISLESLKIEKLKILNQGKNTGSAKGYKDGILKALNINSDFIWLLDDDNLPENQALDVLYQNWQLLSKQYKKDIALLSYRPDRNIFKKAIELNKPNLMLGPNNSFLGINFFHKLKGLVTKSKKNKLTKTDVGKVDVAPYGGLFFRSSLIETIGLPDEDFFLYGDDYDFSYRITQKGDGIFLILKSVVNDLEKSFHLKGKKVNIISNRFINTNSKIKIFYSVRNGINFELKFITNKLVYYSNALCHILGTLLVFILRPKHLWKFKYYIKGIKSSKC
ncbi:glycosyltransferase [Psychroflexus tropicus]|uniref:glycosyltransferase n=1 Tax=Psychroflexus tropicus TaxID=197345 RepID=UPI0003666AE3|nr:glycosyltransferase [Psychroflexus tropicus]